MKKESRYKFDWVAFIIAISLLSMPIFIYACETNAEKERREIARNERMASVQSFEFLIHHPNSSERVMFRGVEYRITSRRGTNRLVIREYNVAHDVMSNRTVIRTTATIQSLN